MTLSLTSIKTVVAARETSRKSCDFKAADAIRDELKAQYAQQEYVQQSPVVEQFSVTHLQRKSYRR